MRLILLFILSSYVLSTRAQTIDESKYLYLLDLDTDSLCLDCEVSNCAALFYNAHSFKYLRHLTLKNLDYDLEHIQYFRRLRSLSIEGTTHDRKRPSYNKPNQVQYDLNELMRHISKSKKLKSLIIDGAEFKYSPTKRL